MSRGVFFERVLRSLKDVFRFLKSTRAILFNSFNWSPMLVYVVWDTSMQMYSNDLVFCTLKQGTRSSHFVCLLAEFSCKLLLINFRKKLEIRKSQRLLLTSDI